MATVVLDLDGLDRLIRVLGERGYQVIGPTVRDDAIVLAEVDSVRCLPAGWGVDAAPGRYALRRREDGALFGHSAGPQSWKRFLHPPRRRLWSGDFEPDHGEAPRYAFLGVRACDLAAIGVLNGVLGRGAFPDESFARRRRQVFVIAANCTEPGGVCFCASMGTGPGATSGYDLALTERIDGGTHHFVTEAGSAEGAEVLALVPHHEAPASEVRAAAGAVEAAAGAMGRQMPPGDLRALMRESRESPHWEDVASRCLTCANCTMVCPTCFCTTTEDVTDLSGQHAERWQHWASCFELDFSYLHGGSVRTSGESRYRQWMSHKLGTWHDQFGTSGCVGCGRCIAWCPAGIDITEEAAALARYAGQERS
ncbi:MULTISPECIES: 4Fe-4S dicluster domain-containing protein [Amycolatopsis]|uniref:4Fe-4S dicluster containing protein n=2 Tax=Amycolatopsis TaxID=1813 RepID=A0A1I3KVJ2_9PSEU|nr:4Fe-4S dicluster domain-containing protein [Amycolatopsis sacchari]SFI76467.1 4Fe-4S dicluster containing protein [Amycolatopsis sacchari]